MKENEQRKTPWNEKSYGASKPNSNPILFFNQSSRYFQPYRSTGGVVRLENHRFLVAVRQKCSTREPREPAPDHNNIDFFGRNFIGLFLGLQRREGWLGHCRPRHDKGLRQGNLAEKKDGLFHR
jgi:hypothetical protein